MNPKIYVTTRRTCSQELRDVFTQEYDPSSKFFNFAFYLLTTNFRDKHSGAIILPKEVISYFAYDYETRRTATTYLNRFKDECMPDLEWTDPSYSTGIARLCLPKFNPKVEEALRKDHKQLETGKNRMILKSGLEFDTRARNALYKEEYTEFSGVEYLMPSPEAKRVIEYMNSRPSKLFDGIVQNIPQAHKLCNSTYDSEILAKVYEQPKPLYAPSVRLATDRVFGRGQTLLSLSSDVRRSVTQGLWECDLKSSQLAIVARLWGLKEVEQFLKAGNSIWSHLQHLGPKHLLKDCLYALIFGMAISNLRKMAPEGFLEDPLILGILHEREAVFRRLIEKGSVRTASGTLLSVTRENVRSVMAQCAQSLELLLLRPLIDVAEVGGFHILLWQHDGITIKFQNRGQALKQIPLLKRAVELQCKEYGVYSEFECVEL